MMMMMNDDDDDDYANQNHHHHHHHFAKRAVKYTACNIENLYSPSPLMTDR